MLLLLVRFKFRAGFSIWRLILLRFRFFICVIGRFLFYKSFAMIEGDDEDKGFR